jgi:hypothetical protein
MQTSTRQEGIPATIRRIYKKEGLLGFYKGSCGRQNALLFHRILLESSSFDPWAPHEVSVLKTVPTFNVAAVQGCICCTAFEAESSSRCMTR